MGENMGWYIADKGAGKEKCRKCKKRIGKGNRFYVEKDYQFVHAECLWKEIDEEAAARESTK